MKNYILTMSRDAINIYKEITIRAEKAPDFWECYELAAKNKCDYFYIMEV